MSRIGRAIVELVFQGEKARAQMAAAKADLGKLGGTGPGGASSFGKVFGDETEAGAKRATEAIKGVGKTAQAVSKAFGLVAIAGFGVAAAAAIDAYINRADTARERTDAITKGVRQLRDELARSATLKLDTSDATKKINAMRASVQDAIAAQNEGAISQLSIWEKIDDFWLGGKNAANAIAVAQDAAAQVNAARIANEKKLRRDEADERKKSEQELADDAERRLEDLTARNRGELAQVELDEKRSMAKIAEEWKKAKTDQHKFTLLQLELETKQAAGLARKRIEDEQKEKEESARKAADATARALQDALDRVADNFAERLADAGRAAFDAQRQASSDSLRQLTATVGTLKAVIEARLQAEGVNLAIGDFRAYGG